MNMKIGAMSGFRLRALLAFLIVGGFLFFSVYKSEVARSGGAEIILESRPIDPRDIFFGHYAILSYDIQTLTSEQSFELMDGAFKAEAERAVAAPDGTLAYNNGLRMFSQRPQPTPAYIVLQNDGEFERPDFATQDLEKAHASGAPFLKANWTVGRHHKECEDDQTPGADCEWQVSITSNLPNRYYADKETALALQNLQGDAQRFAREQRQFENCERRREATAEGDPPLQGCEDATEPPSAAEKFGVVLSASDTGEAVIKGIVFGDQKAIDSLTGPRLTKKQLD